MAENVEYVLSLKDLFSSKINDANRSAQGLETTMKGIAGLAAVGFGLIGGIDFLKDSVKAFNEADKAGAQLRAKARQEVEEAVDAMKKRGLVVNKPNAEQMRAWNDLAEKLYPRIRGTLVPADTFDEVFRHLKAYRAGKTK